MKYLARTTSHVILAVWVTALLSGFWVPLVHAVTYTNDNFHTLAHERPASFSVHADGRMTGVTETGRSFTQVPVANQYDIRLHKFSIDEAFFYVSDRGIMYTTSDARALSIYLTRA